MEKLEDLIYKGFKETDRKFRETDRKLKETFQETEQEIRKVISSERVIDMQ
jgi:hypothetical protein